MEKLGYYGQKNYDILPKNMANMINHGNTMMVL